MSRAREVRERLLPWGGFVLGGLGLALAHQVGTDSVFDNCATSPTVPVIFCIVGLLLIGAGALSSWTVWRRDGEGSARRLIATVSLLASALFAFAVLMPLIGALVIPSCHA